MSRLYYFASDSVLEEQPNPYVRLLSVNQALEMGVEVNLDMFGDDFDKDEPNVILFCEDETKFEYPNIYDIDKNDFYDDIGTTKQYCTALEWDYSDTTVDVILKYIQNHMKMASELELWSVWLGYGDIPSRKKIQCKAYNLTVDKLKEIYNSEMDLYCLTVVR
jgi:hypothetical protein